MQAIAKTPQEVSRIKKTIKEFEAFQKEKLGYLKYKITGSGENHIVNAYTSYGLFIKASMVFVNEEQILEFIKKRTEGITSIL